MRRGYGAYKQNKKKTEDEERERERERSCTFHPFTYVDGVVDVLLVTVENVQTDGESLDAALCPAMAGRFLLLFFFLFLFLLLLLLLLLVAAFIVTVLLLFLLFNTEFNFHLKRLFFWFKRDKLTIFSGLESSFSPSDVVDAFSFISMTSFSGVSAFS